jgi:antitoxin component of RelBE/YafQ-DinJ toxin-antitoxin module
MFRCRIERKLIAQASKVAEEIGTTPGEVVRMLFKQMVKRRAVPFPLQAEAPEDDVVGPLKRRIGLFDEL